MKIRSLIIAGAFLAIGLFSKPVEAEDILALRPGMPAPDFTLQDQSGNSVSSKDYRGKYLVLEWTNPDCPFVKRHYSEQTMKNLSKKYSEKGVAWLAINSTHYMDTERNRTWSEAQQIAYPVLNDAEGLVGKLYGAKTTPHIFVIDPEGKLVYQGAIDDDPQGEMNSAERQLYVDRVLSADQTQQLSSTRPYGCSVKYKS